MLCPDETIVGVENQGPKENGEATSYFVCLRPIEVIPNQRLLNRILTGPFESRREAEISLSLICHEVPAVRVVEVRDLV